MARSRGSNRPHLGVIFWIAAILFISILLMFKLPSIREVLENTGFVEVVFENGPSREPSDGERSRRDEAVREEAPLRDTTDPSALQDLLVPGSPSPSGEEDAPVAEAPRDKATDKATEDAPQQVLEVSPPPQPTEEERPVRTSQSRVYFIRVTDDGRIRAEAVSRSGPATRSPLTKALETLISGPTAEDLDKGLLTLLPEGTRLLSARVEGGVAYLSFNEAFRFNSLGVEGHLAQLQQVVLTATTFSTVEAVQILIEGQQMDYLSGDGVYIGRPLRPGDFRG
ncbi:Sporulation and spore germination [Alkalispirochaeta americana]|uniref:Sporulation and spore germination n=1 Tax=Alkalispirochaeta americana TaxID=159291 RepID=A0A1N6W0T6_9SPIO|nr:GerMN domain-containing protein [Alkalispirochaeta americana]SIQ83602.1 Sporulation and spore germination [Alkalispirochaeta americana]